MSLARAFTTRRHAKNKSIDTSSTSSTLPQRWGTTKHNFAAGSIQRSKISAPVELISTTNMLSYNAPDLYPSARTSSSADESETSPSIMSTPPTSPDSSSIECSPTTPEPNHLTNFFNMVEKTEEAPAVPERALSHTKEASMSISTKRSMSQISSRKPSFSTTPSVTTFPAHPIEAPVEEHPFGNELAQVSELAEEFGVQEKMDVLDAEEQDVVSKGFFKFCAEDYMSEIQDLFMSAFTDKRPSMSPMWI
ncbi:hypothetical protein PVAG01_10887 [Phlyctema vagabunda]|uniref:Uncharacterized protein n=1 Tax=Phlyctema vagabunda TaxID=108571 RepID=A0ABR4P3X1_9HELO